MNISALTKGFILPVFKFEIRLRRGGISYGDGYDDLKDKLKKFEQEKEEIDYIKVYIDWDKDKSETDKKIYVKLIKKTIEVELLKDTLKHYSITVEMIK
jgi:predicted nucleotide-binding protein (sugar kinase/HSP70/actin superfamily)